MGTLDRLHLRHPARRYGRGEHVDGRAPWWRHTLEKNLADAAASPSGLSSREARQRLAQAGANTLSESMPRRLPLALLRRFTNPLVLLLLFAGVISATTGETISAAIIGAIVIASVTMDALQEFRAGEAAHRLKDTVALQATVLRDGQPCEIPAADIVPGDVVRLHAGQLVPADGRLLAARDLFVTQASLTGEAWPVEKTVEARPASDELQQAANALFMGTSIVSGQAEMLVCATGNSSHIGMVASSLALERTPTAFERGIRAFGLLILRFATVLLVFVTLSNLVAGKPPLQSFLFALALAVGLTPELLPMIVTGTLTKGALRLAAQNVIVKRLSAIHDLGALEVLCTDKTGTLTEGSIELVRHIDLAGRDCEAVLRYAWLNSHFESGVHTALEDAILAHEAIDAEGWRKIDEVPFDFERKRLSVLLARGEGEREQRWLILKGAPEAVLAHCTRYPTDPDGAPQSEAPFDAVAAAQARTRLNELEQEGFRTLAIAVRAMPAHIDHARLDDESELVLVGIAAFLDPPKRGAAEALARLRQAGVAVKIVTGDSDLVARHVCTALGLAVSGVLSGSEIAQMDDATLRARVASVNLFCRVDPMQKNRVILALRAEGSTVGYLGDGINDAPALHNADVGISVDGAVEVAREAADLILLQRNLHVLADGVLEGRRTSSNVRKYLMAGSSSNFGNMLSMAAAALFLPFLPMQPVQVLLNNILYDLSETAIPLDTVDRRELLQPRKWDVRFVRDFTLVMGPVSTLFDLAIFYLMFHVFRLGEHAFQTGWFIESLVTQVLVLFVIRTHGSPFSVLPHPALAAGAFSVLAIALACTLTPLGKALGFVPLPGALLAVILALTVSYLLLAQGVKLLFYRLHS